MSTTPLFESAYDWVKIPKELPVSNLVLVTAKTRADTSHPSGKEPFSKRSFKSPKDKEELRSASRSLARRRITVNHKDVLPYPYRVHDSEWNESTESVEALLYLPSQYTNYIRKRRAEGKDVKFSVEFFYRDTILNEDGSYSFQGLVFDGISILIEEKMFNTVCGDPNTTCIPVTEFEANEVIKGVLCEMSEIEKPNDELPNPADVVPPPVPENTGTIDATPIDSSELVKQQLLNRNIELEKTVTEKAKALEETSATLIEQRKLVEELTTKNEEVTKLLTDANGAVEQLRTLTKQAETEKRIEALRTKHIVKKEVLSKIEKLIPQDEWDSTLRGQYGAVIEDLKDVAESIRKL